MSFRYQWVGAASLLLLFFLCCLGCAGDSTEDTFEVDQWDKLTLEFEGPSVSESDPENPFTTYRLWVDFHQGNYSVRIPGFFAADGNAAETSAEEGNIWKVRFRPDRPGIWTYEVSFRKGPDIAISDDPSAGEGKSFDGTTGTFEVVKNEDHPGRLETMGGHYLRYASSGEYYLKGGADSPENFLAFHEFDGTYKGSAPENRQGEAANTDQLHRYTPHVADWKEGDPTWQNGKGKAIIGALNYLASEKMNSVYFLTMNIGGDGKDVWPYTGYDERYRFDCSKLDQWEIVFDHMDDLGLSLHIVLQETENEKLLDDGDTGPQRKLYYRELIARFSHHLGVTWNMGEENGPMDFSPNAQNTEQQKAMVQYISEHDPYENLIVIHTHHNNESKEELFTPLLGFEHLGGMSIQNGNPHHTYETVLEWREKSTRAGKSWVMNLDELGPANRGIDPDDREDNNQAEMRDAILWATLMAGGGGVEWYFGYLNHNNDLGCEDWRSRDRLWDYTRYALEFFHEHLPFWEMVPDNSIVTHEGTFYSFYKPDEVYSIYLSEAGSCEIDLSGSEANYDVHWYNPRTGGPLQDGSVKIVSGGGTQSVGSPPDSPDEDWVVLLTSS